MKKFLLISGLCALFFISCRRDNNNPNNLADAVQLTGIVDSLYISGALANIDSIKFTYDASGFLSGWTYATGFGTNIAGQDFAFTRNDQGQIIKATSEYGVPTNGALQPDGGKVDYDFHYNPGATQPDYIYQYLDGENPWSADSIALQYAGSSLTDYRLYDISGPTPHSKFTETIWTYDRNGQLATSIVGAQDSTNPVYTTYVFDGKVNPLKMGAEAVIANLYNTGLRISSGNIQSDFGSWPAKHETGGETWTYVYRNDRRPSRAIYINFQPVKIVTTYNYSK